MRSLKGEGQERSEFGLGGVAVLLLAVLVVGFLLRGIVFELISQAAGLFDDGSASSSEAVIVPPGVSMISGTVRLPPGEYSSSILTSELESQTVSSELLDFTCPIECTNGVDVHVVNCDAEDVEVTLSHIAEARDPVEYLNDVILEVVQSFDAGAPEVEIADGRLETSSCSD